MINLPTPQQLLAFQIQHYSIRFSEAKSIEERAFLRGELYRLKKRQQDLINTDRVVANKSGRNKCLFIINNFLNQLN